MRLASPLYWSGNFRQIGLKFHPWERPRFLSLGLVTWLSNSDSILACCSLFFFFFNSTKGPCYQVPAYVHVTREGASAEGNFWRLPESAVFCFSRGPAFTHWFLCWEHLSFLLPLQDRSGVISRRPPLFDALSREWVVATFLLGAYCFDRFTYLFLILSTSLFRR